MQDEGLKSLKYKDAKFNENSVSHVTDSPSARGSRVATEVRGRVRVTREREKVIHAVPDDEKRREGGGEKDGEGFSKDAWSTSISSR